MELSNFVIGIHSNVKPTAGMLDGHAWITVTHKVSTNNRLVTSYGLWPDEHPRTVDNGKKSDIRIGLEPAKGYANRYYALTHLQHKQLIALINTTEKWFYTNNCSSWASSLIQKLFRTEIDADDWLGIETPREISKSILEREAKDATTVENPKVISWALTRRGYRRVSN